MGYIKSDTHVKLIDHQIKSSDCVESYIKREYYFTYGHKLIGGTRRKQYYVDYPLSFQNINLAIIDIDMLKDALISCVASALDRCFGLQREIFR